MNTDSRLAFQCVEFLAQRVGSLLGGAQGFGQRPTSAFLAGELYKVADLALFRAEFSAFELDRAGQVGAELATSASTRRKT